MKRRLIAGTMLIVLLLAATVTADAKAEAAKVVVKDFCTVPIVDSAKGKSALAIDRCKLVYYPKSKTIKSCTPTQIVKKNKRAIKKGGITLKKKSKKRVVYESTWMVKYTLLPKTIRKNIAQKATRVGDMMIIKYTYEARGNGVIKRTGCRLSVAK